MASPEAASWKGSKEYWEKLAVIYSEILRHAPGSNIFVPLADALFNLGKTAEAIETLELGVALNPNNRAGKILLAQLKYDTGAVDEARNILEEVAKKWPDATAAVFLLSKMHERDGNLESAWKLSSALLDYFPDASFIKKLAARHEKLLKAVKYEEKEAPESRLEPVAEAMYEEPPPVAQSIASALPVDDMIALPEPEPMEVIMAEEAVPVEAEPEMEMVDEEPLEDERPTKQAQKIPENQMALFRLESMLSKISGIKGTRKEKRN